MIYFQLIVSILLYWSAINLRRAKSCLYGSAMVRNLLADFSLLISVAICSASSFIVKSNVRTLSLFKSLLTMADFDRSSDRSWVVDFEALNINVVVSSILPGFSIFLCVFCFFPHFISKITGLFMTIIFFIDHNISSSMTQDALLKLKKPAAYHLDFFVQGFSIILTAILGLPPVCSMLPQSPLHTKSLSLFTIVKDSESKEFCLECTGVLEQRCSNFLQGVFFLTFCFRPFNELLTMIPRGVSSGCFIYYGHLFLEDNELLARIMLHLADPDIKHFLAKSRKHLHLVSTTESFRKSLIYTAVQLSLLLLSVILFFTQAAVALPLVVVIFALFRAIILPANMFGMSEISPDSGESFLDIIGK